MKYRKGFVTNSSSCSFLITNISNEPKTLQDLMTEMKEDILEDYNEMKECYESDSWFFDIYPDFESYFQTALKDAEELCESYIQPNESIERECGDHHDTDGLAETMIHSETWKDLTHPSFTIDLIESHH